MKNIMSGGFLGPVMPVSLEAEAIAGVLTYKSADLPKTPDLAILCQPIEKAPAILQELRERGTGCFYYPIRFTFFHCFRLG